MYSLAVVVAIWVTVLVEVDAGVVMVVVVLELDATGGVPAMNPPPHCPKLFEEEYIPTLKVATKSQRLSACQVNKLGTHVAPAVKVFKAMISPKNSAPAPNVQAADTILKQA